MPAIRIVPVDDDDDFPYEEALRLLEQDADLEPADLTEMIEAGRRMGWSQEMIVANEALAAGGKCFSFTLRKPPHLSGTLYEDNIFFSINGNERDAKTYIRSLAKLLGAAVYEH